MSSNIYNVNIKNYLDFQIESLDEQRLFFERYKELNCKHKECVECGLVRPLTHFHLSESRIYFRDVCYECEALYESLEKFRKLLIKRTEERKMRD